MPANADTSGLSGSTDESLFSSSHGLTLVDDVTDHESVISDELPAVLWGKDAGGNASKCKSNGATAVGLWVVYENGLEGYGVYGVTSSNWDASNVASSLVTSSGFLASCGAPSFLHTQNNLPMAWSACTNTFSTNFDVDHTVNGGSNWRASSSGWSRARLRFYCSTSAVACAAPLPPSPPPPLPLSPPSSPPPPLHQGAMAACPSNAGTEPCCGNDSRCAGQTTEAACVAACSGCDCTWVATTVDTRASGTRASIARALDDDETRASTLARALDDDECGATIEGTDTKTQTGEYTGPLPVYSFVGLYIVTQTQVHAVLAPGGGSETPDGQTYECTGRLTGGYGVSQAVDVSCSQSTHPLDATYTNAFGAGTCYSAYYSCTTCTIVDASVSPPPSPFIPPFSPPPPPPLACPCRRAPAPPAPLLRRPIPSR